MKLSYKLISLVLFSSFVITCNNVKHKKWADHDMIFNMSYTGKIMGMGANGAPSGYYEGTLYSFDTIEKERSIGHLINGQECGLLRKFYSNGTMKASCYYENDKKNGLCKMFFENGQLQNVATFVNDKLNGFYASYFQNGILNSYELGIAGKVIYGIEFNIDSKVLREGWDYYIKYDSIIHLGAKFQATLILPTSMMDPGDSSFNVSILPKNFNTMDSLNKYSLKINNIKNKVWTYDLLNKQTGIKSRDSIDNVPIDKKGKAVFEFTPTKKGSYIFEGIVGYAKIQSESNNAPEYMVVTKPIAIKFTVIQ